ncbi:MAG: T9SS type A sorting domain-containing protein [Chitinophagales bacterium]
MDEWFLSVNYDAARNLIWLGRINGIVKYDFISEEVINSMDVPAMMEGSSIQVIEVDNENNVWFGANNDKVYQFDGDIWTDYTVGDQGDFIIEIKFNGTKTYFGLTDGAEGFQIYDSADESWEYYNTTTDPSMTSNSLTQLAIDGENIWMAHSDAGISVLRTADPVGIISNESTGPVNVFPNPAVNSILVDMLISADDVITINDISGHEVINVSGNSIIDISDLPAGIYVLKIFEDLSGEIFTSKFSVVK